MMERKPFAGVILAGGEGKRWGGPKAWAKLPDGTTFLEACAGILREAGARWVVATLPYGADDPRIEGLTAVPLPASDWEKAALVPVDHPLVSVSSIKNLVGASAPASIPSYHGKHGHPICVARSVVQNIVGGELDGPTLREVLRSVDSVVVPVEDIGVISNCNTPEALSKALKSCHP
jgi:CTP:molybdopterin cytidylyltransferase MocA